MNFERNQDSKKVLNLGAAKINHDLWMKEMPDYFGYINSWAFFKKIKYTYGLLDCKKGYYNFWKISVDQITVLVCSVELRLFIDELKKFRNKKMQEKIMVNSSYGKYDKKGINISSYGEKIWNS